MSDETLQLLKAFIDAVGYDIGISLINPATGEEVEPLFEYEPDTVYTVTKKKPKKRSQAKSEGYTKDFELFWTKWDAKGKGSKQDAFKQWRARFNERDPNIPSDELFSQIENGAMNYFSYCKETGQFVMQVCRFLGQGEHYLNDYTIPDNVIKQNREKQEWEIVPEKDHLLMDWAKKHGFKVDGMDKVFDTRRKLQAQIKERRDNE